MKVNIELNGKTAELDIPDEKLVELGLVEKKKKPTGYERVEFDGRYWLIMDSTREEPLMENDNSSIDECRYHLANYYSNQNTAENNFRADTLMRCLRRFAAENGGIPSAEDWKDDGMIKWHVYGRICDGMIDIDRAGAYCRRDLFQIYFKSEEACEKAIEEFKDELTWYFTEYQAMLY